MQENSHQEQAQKSERKRQVEFLKPLWQLERTLGDVNELFYDGKMDKETYRRINLQMEDIRHYMMSSVDERGWTADRDREIQAEKEKGIKYNIDNAKSFDELTKVINRSGGLRGSQEFFEPERLHRLINEVRNNEKEIDYITSTNGLRDKVAELIEQGNAKH